MSSGYSSLLFPLARWVLPLERGAKKKKNSEHLLKTNGQFQVSVIFNTAYSEVSNHHSICSSNRKFY